MKILAIDTATELCSAALLMGESVLTRELETARGHAEHILPMIDLLLAEGGVALRGLDAIAFGRGPGAFTGIRLAASVTQGLAFGADLPVVPVSDLAAVARRAFDEDAGCSGVLVCNDARMKEVYWASFARNAEVGLALEGLEHVSPPEKVIPAEGGLIGAGRGFRVYPQLSALVAHAHDDWLPRAQEIARLAVAGPRLPPDEALPVYVRHEVARPSS